MNFGNKLQEQIHNKFKSINKFAKSIGASSSHVWAWCMGKSAPSETYMAKIIETLEPSFIDMYILLDRYITFVGWQRVKKVTAECLNNAHICRRITEAYQSCRDTAMNDIIDFICQELHFDRQDITIFHILSMVPVDNDRDPIVHIALKTECKRIIDNIFTQYNNTELQKIYAILSQIMLSGLSIIGTKYIFTALMDIAILRHYKEDK